MRSKVPTPKEQIFISKNRCESNPFNFRFDTDLKNPLQVKYFFYENVAKIFWRIANKSHVFGTLVGDKSDSANT